MKGAARPRRNRKKKRKERKRVGGRNGEPCGGTRLREQVRTVELRGFVAVRHDIHKLNEFSSVFVHTFSETTRRPFLFVPRRNFETCVTLRVARVKSRRFFPVFARRIFEVLQIDQNIKRKVNYCVK